MDCNTSKPVAMKTKQRNSNWALVITPLLNENKWVQKTATMACERISYTQKVWIGLLSTERSQSSHELTVSTVRCAQSNLTVRQKLTVSFKEFENCEMLEKCSVYTAAPLETPSLFIPHKCIMLQSVSITAISRSGGQEVDGGGMVEK